MAVSTASPFCVSLYRPSIVALRLKDQLPDCCFWHAWGSDGTRGDVRDKVQWIVGTGGQ